MDKYLITIYVPSISQSYDVFIPKKTMMSNVLELIKKAIGELSDGLFYGNDNSVLCRYEDGSIVNINLSVSELNIHNGTKLILI